MSITTPTVEKTTILQHAKITGWFFGVWYFIQHSVLSDIFHMIFISQCYPIMLIIVRDCRSNLSFVEKNSSAENTAYMED